MNERMNIAAITRNGSTWSTQVDGELADAIALATRRFREGENGIDVLRGPLLFLTITKGERTYRFMVVDDVCAGRRLTMVQDAEAAKAADGGWIAASKIVQVF